MSRGARAQAWCWRDRCARAAAAPVQGSSGSERSASGSAASWPPQSGVQSLRVRRCVFPAVVSQSPFRRFAVGRVPVPARLPPVPPCRSDCERPTRRGHARAMHTPAAHEPLPRVSVPIPASARTLVPSWFTELEPTAREPRPRRACSCSLGRSESRVSVCSQGPGSVSLCRGLPGPGRKGAELVAAAAPPVGLSSVVAVLQCPWCFSPAERCMFP